MLTLEELPKARLNNNLHSLLAMVRHVGIFPNYIHAYITMPMNARPLSPSAIFHGHT